MWTALDILIILAPFAWAISWWFGIKAIAQAPKSWHVRTSIVSLSIVTISGLLWLPLALVIAHNNGGYEHLQALERGSGIAALVCACALALSLFGKPQLIIPIAITCLGTASFWIGTTIP